MTLRGLAAVAALGLLATITRPQLGTIRATASQPASSPAVALRVDSVGFLPGDVKRGYLMADHAMSGATFTVDDSDGSVAWSGRVGTTSRGAWSAAYPDVYPLTFSGLRTEGRYVIHVSGPVTATSSTFRIQGARALYGAVVKNGVSFFQSQRDGADQVAGPLDRQPSHLDDAHAAVYRQPHFRHPDRDDAILGGELTRVPSHAVIDAEGGWFDAGDYLKFTHTAAYADVLLYASLRALGPAAPPSLGREARFGERWLNQMWHQKSRTLYLQVGIGSGNTAGTFTGDHDLWRLPQQDDGDTRHRDRYATAHRPVFRAAPPGQPISPNLVGRVSAAFAMAAQSDATSHPSRAGRELRAATSLYAMAATRHPPQPLVTSLPVEYYPESSWHDDMALGATEIALADLDLGDSATTYLADAARWVKDYISTDTGDTLNLYDTSALAESDLFAAMQRTGSDRALAVSRAALLADLRRQIRSGSNRSSHDPFRAGGDERDFDVDSHMFGLISTVAMYDRATGTDAYQDFATAQRDWLFGANAWGASFMVGEGTNFPECMQSQIANLSGGLDGTPPPDLGAVVNGPNSAGLFHGGLGGRQPGMRRCPTGAERYQAFNGRGSRYLDDVRAWQTDEPALDMTGGAVLAAALQESLALDSTTRTSRGRLRTAPPLRSR